MKKLPRLSSFFSRFEYDLADFLGVFGFISMFYGLFKAYKPAAFVVCGVILMAISYFKARR
jgi:hypothetical protein